MSKKKVCELAQLAGLRVAKKAGFNGESFAVGDLQGFLVTAAWTRKGNQAGVSIHVRFKSQSWSGGPEGLRTAAAESQELKEVLRKKKVPASLLKALVQGPDSIGLFWRYSFFAPKPSTVLGILRALTGIAARFAQPIAGTCESCGASSGVEVMLADWIPVSVCSNCRLRQDAEAQRQEEEYTRLESNAVLGIAFGVGAALVLGALWGGIAFGIHRIFAYGAILIGIAIAWAINKGMGKVNLLGRVLTVLLTLGSVFWGDYVCILLSSAKHLDTSIGFGLATAVAQHFFEIEFSEGSGFLSLLFGLIGAGYVLYSNRPPKFRKHYQSINSIT